MQFVRDMVSNWRQCRQWLRWNLLNWNFLPQWRSEIKIEIEFKFVKKIVNKSPFYIEKFRRRQRDRCWTRLTSFWQSLAVQQFSVISKSVTFANLNDDAGGCPISENFFYYLRLNSRFHSDFWLNLNRKCSILSKTIFLHRSQNFQNTNKFFWLFQS